VDCFSFSSFVFTCPEKYDFFFIFHFFIFSLGGGNLSFSQFYSMSNSKIRFKFKLQNPLPIGVACSNPYKLQWINDDENMLVNQQVKVKFLEKTYKGDDRVKQVFLQALKGEFERLQMKENEGVTEFIS